MFLLTKNGSKIESVLGQQTEVEGNIRTNEALRIDGKVKGGVSAESVIVGKSGVVLGNITANKVVVAGKVKGNISSATMLELLSTGQVLGDIRTNKLIITDGGNFEGNCQMLKNDGQVIEINQDGLPDEPMAQKHLKVLSGSSKR